MGVLDGPMASVAKTLTGTFGRSATLKRGGTALYDNATGKASMATTDVPCSAAPVAGRDSQIPDTLIQAEDRVVFVPRLDVTTKPVPDQDTFVMDSVTWRIIAVAPYSSGESDAGYDLLLRR